MSTDNEDLTKDLEASSPLTDVEDIVSTHPDLTPSEWEAVEKATPWLKAKLRPDVRKDLDVEYAEKYAKEIDLIRGESQTFVKKQMEDWKKEQLPLDTKELQVLLSQEYLTFDVKVQTRDVDKKPCVREFTLVELPQVTEKRFLESAQKHLISFIEESASMDWTLNMSTASSLQNILDTMPSALDVAAELVSICLNPWNDDKEITSKWVAEHLSTFRIANILIAQCEVNKYRDFFSNGFRLFRTLKSR